MGIFRRWQDWLAIRRFKALPSDSLLDWYITDALADEARSPVPPGAWDRLRKAIVERKPVHGYGMWVLDETLSDPPAKSSGTLSDAEMKRAMQIYNCRRAARRSLVGHPSLSGLSPTFIVVVTL